MKIFYGLFFFLYFACNTSDKNQLEATNNTDSAKKEKSYFPVIDFIKSEIKIVDSLPVGIMKYRTSNNIIDSGYIQLEEFHQLAKEFLPADLEKGHFESNFSETSFFDNTTQYASFLYSGTKQELQVTRVDVLTKAEDVVYNKVQSIYIEKRINKTDTSIIKKLYWKTGQNFQINTEMRTPEQKTITEQIKVVWNPWN
jgi:hypothetical protein